MQDCGIFPGILFWGGGGGGGGARLRGSKSLIK